ncbi:SufE family protein [Rheinheimera baltica]|uniref:SufE family protein n=1 Tax=Rheinheimera baltica TaxID=67576 RepID=A0ABT9HYD8_9GAMM|nr:SufE family protein [Rheinheimera baltica]MDP5136151.1 SufE family protein [Rheinheimera baltica]MDP5144476.1 SufE family protein [Rheinheimera baltica]MDP5149080.1 SufE family protein [Rheinheimera baltica]
MKLEQLLAETRSALVQINEQDLSKITQAKDWQSKYRVLMQLGKKLPPVPEKMKQPELLVKGCESRAWLLHYHNKTDDKHYFVLDSEARIVKGLMAIMLCLVNGMSSAELAKFDLNHKFDQLNLKPYLSQSRGSGLTAMAEKIKACC